MSSKITRLITLSLLTVFLIASNALAFHKENQLKTDRKTGWDGSSDTKKEFQNTAKEEFCAFSAKAGFKKIQGDPIEDLTTGEQKKDDDTGELVFEEVDSPIMNVSGYHSSIEKKIVSPLKPSLPSMNLDAEWGKVKLVEILKMYCLQDSTKERPSKFKGSYLQEFYTQVAKDNGYFKKDSEEGDYNQKLLDGPEGDQILKIGIIIKNPNAVWYVPDFLEEQEFENIKKEKAATKKKEEKRKADERKKIKKKGNDQWISKNKQNYIDKFNKKLDEYESVITKLKTNRNKLINKYKEYVELEKKAKEDIEIAFDDLANLANQEIKDKKRQIRDDKKSFLSGVEITEYKERLKKIEKINFKKYKNYTSLKSLIKNADKSDKVQNFIGTDATKILGITFKQSKIGYIQEFNNIKDRDLGSGSEVDEKNIDKLIYDIDNQINNINKFIIKPVQELVALDDELGKKIDWPKYIIYFVIFLVLVGVIAVVIIQQRKMKDLKADADEKVGSLKSDLENKIKDTSEQIKTVGRTAAIAQESGIAPTPEPVQEIPKTPEEIISAKYDELVSEYKEALEDFSKVAAFKQKWNGLALSRKERQDGTKTILTNSNQAFEKSGIWCVNFDEKYFAFPGSTVKSNMATYMNMEFMKAGIDFKGIFSISEGSNYSTEPAVLRRGGAGFVVESNGKISFPN